MAHRRNQARSKQLRAERERNSLVLQANQDGVFDADLLTGQNYYSTEWLAQIGYAPGELPGTPETWWERVHPEDRLHVETALNSYLTRQSSGYSIEYRIRHRDGHWCWVQVRGKAVWNRAGQPIRLVGSHKDITDKKRAEEDLRLSDSRLRTFLDNNPALTFIKDEDGRMIYTNASLRKHFQIAPDDWLGKLDAELWPPAVAAQLRATDMAVLTSEQITEIVEQVPLADGRMRQFLSTKFAFRDASGRKALGGITIDVTDHLAMQAALRDSEARYRELFERNPLPGWIYRMHDAQLLEVNQAAINHYGWTREEFLHLTLRDIRLPEEFDVIESYFNEGAPRREGSPLPVWHHRRKSASPIRVELTSIELLHGDERLRLVLVNDVTARVEAEERIKLAYQGLEKLVEARTAELRSSEVKWRALVEASPQMIWATGPSGHSEFTSPHASAYTGLTNSELLDHKWLEALHPDDVARTAESWQASLHSGNPYCDEYRLRSKTGEYRWFKVLARPMRDDDGQIVRWVGTCTDIQDQKRAEEILEAAVASRTMELAEARDRAQAATQAKSSFLAAMSHEIRTPMNGVIGMANLMLETDLTSQQRCYMDTIRSSGDALLTVINDILDLSKIEANRLSLEHAPFDLSTLVEEAMEVVGTVASPKKLRLDYKVEPAVPLDLVGDSVRPRQVVLNLLSNAVKFTAHGSVSLAVSREAVKEAFTVLRFAVQDTGIGMTAKQQEGLFTAFHQAEQSITRNFGGTGLGLAISKRLVEMMGGSIGVHSVPGEGSTFWFNVCLENAPVSEERIALRGKHLGFVRGNQTEASAIAPHLEGAGLKVSTFPQIPQADGFPVDFWIVDSAAITNQCMADRLFSGARRAVFILGSKRDFAFPLRLAEGAVTFIEKPIRRSALLQAVGASTRGQSRTVASGTSQNPPIYKEGALVLLAEDNKVNQLVARLQLERLGCIVDVVDNGVAACEAIQRKSYDVVFMDCQMPVMSGFEATQRIRALESTRRTPIIALTAGVLQEERDRCYACGMDDFLSKPISATDLQKALDHWVGASVQ